MTCDQRYTKESAIDINHSYQKDKNHKNRNWEKTEFWRRKGVWMEYWPGGVALFLTLLLLVILALWDLAAGLRRLWVGVPSVAGGIASMLELPVAQIDAERPLERGTRCGLSSVMARTDGADACKPSRRPTMLPTIYCYSRCCRSNLDVCSSTPIGSWTSGYPLVIKLYII